MSDPSRTPRTPTHLAADTTATRSSGSIRLSAGGALTASRSCFPPPVLLPGRPHQTSPPSPTNCGTPSSTLMPTQTPFGTDDDGFVSGGYLISVGSLHRALVSSATAQPSAAAVATVGPLISGRRKSSCSVTSWRLRPPGSPNSERWKAEALVVLGQWDEVWEALGRPGPLRVIEGGRGVDRGPQTPGNRPACRRPPRHPRQETT